MACSSEYHKPEAICSDLAQEDYGGVQSLNFLILAVICLLFTLMLSVKWHMSVWMLDYTMKSIPLCSEKQPKPVAYLKIQFHPLIPFL